MPWNVLIRPGSPGLGAELAADPRDPDPQVLEIVAVFRSPDLGQQLRVEHDLARVGGEVLQEQPLGPRQLDELAVTRDEATLEVDLDVVEGEDAGAGAGAARAPEDGPDARGEFIGMERFGDVVVGAQVEALRLVGGRALRGEQDDRDRSSLAELAHDLDAIEVGHDDVEQDDVRSDLLGLLERLLATVRGDDAEALLGEDDRHEFGDPGLVVRDEDQRLGTHAAPPG